MSDELTKIGLYFDELNTLRVLDPEIYNQTNDLKDECINFTEKLTDFQQIALMFLTITDNFAGEVDQQKMRTIGVQNLLKTISKERENEQQQIQTQIVEKTLELDRLRIEYQHLQRVESEQQEIIENYYLNQ